jgi:hypothetical protein
MTAYFRLEFSGQGRMDYRHCSAQILLVHRDLSILVSNGQVNYTLPQLFVNFLFYGYKRGPATNGQNSRLDKMHHARHSMRAIFLCWICYYLPANDQGLSCLSPCALDCVSQRTQGLLRIPRSAGLPRLTIREQTEPPTHRGYALQNPGPLHLMV